VSTRPCPRGDGGICSIPDRTLVATRGTLEVRSRAQVLTDFPDLDLDGQLRRVREADLLRNAFRSIDDPGELDTFLRKYSDTRSDVGRDESRGVFKALVRKSGRSTVLVYCSPCEDIFTIEAP
jgi:hypothetical protein